MWKVYPVLSFFPLQDGHFLSRRLWAGTPEPQLPPGGKDVWLFLCSIKVSIRTLVFFLSSSMENCAISPCLEVSDILLRLLEAFSEERRDRHFKNCRIQTFLIRMCDGCRSEKLIVTMNQLRYSVNSHGIARKVKFCANLYLVGYLHTGVLCDKCTG
jgi:hypothetical protein